VNPTSSFNLTWHNHRLWGKPAQFLSLSQTKQAIFLSHTFCSFHIKQDFVGWRKGRLTKWPRCLGQFNIFGHAPILSKVMSGQTFKNQNCGQLQKRFTTSGLVLPTDISVFTQLINKSQSNRIKGRKDQLFVFSMFYLAHSVLWVCLFYVIFAWAREQILGHVFYSLN
jgi:hypothetical protein